MKRLFSGDFAHKVGYSLISVVIFAIFFAGMIFLTNPTGTILDTGWTLETAEDIRAVTLPYTEDVDEKVTRTYRVTFPYVDADTLVIPRPSANAMLVFLNGQQVYSTGNIRQPTANIWNMLHLVSLPVNLMREENVLEIVLGRDNTIGLQVYPFLASRQEVFLKISLANWLSSDFLLIAIGAALMIGVFLIRLSRTFKHRQSPEVFMGHAAILSAIYCFDFIYRPTTINLPFFLQFEKVLMICAYLAVFSFICGLEKYYRSRLHVAKIIAIPTLLSVLLLGSMWSMAVLFRILPYLNLVLLVNLVVAVVLILRGKRGKNWLVIPAVLLALSILQMIPVMVLNLSVPFVMQYIVVISSLIFGMNFVLEFNQVMRKNEELRLISNVDPLTGVFNRRILEELDLSIYSMLIAIDMDNLKYYNDSYGHQEGDALLTLLANTARQNLRQTDLIIRTGGDEFILLLKDVNLPEAENIILRIRQQFIRAVLDERIDFSYGIVSIQDSLEITMRKADEKMYQMKRARKNLVLVADSGNKPAYNRSRQPG